jgi:hypothetical protein
MSTLYPSLPSLPLCASGAWPQAYISKPRNRRDSCPICGAAFVSNRSMKQLISSRNEAKYGQPPLFPHKRYACGGYYRDLGDGTWGGQCLAPKTKQLELNLVEDT